MNRVWNDADLDALRQVGDPEADAAICEYIDAHDEVTARTVMQRLVSDTQVGSHPPTRLLVSYFADQTALPPWADRELIVRGQAAFAERGMEIATALFGASLPTAYAAARGAQVIFDTTELVSTPHRRIAETAQMICDVMSVELHPGDDPAEAMGPGTRAYAAAWGVRLMHAAVRQLVNQDVALERCSATEMPVNQEDLLGTLLTFTTVVFDALERLGSPMSPTEQDAYMHTWCVVGHLIGIRPDLLPMTRHEARDLDGHIRRRQNASGDDGQRLAQALVEEMRANIPKPLRRFPEALIRHAAGDTVADTIGVARGSALMCVCVRASVVAAVLWHRAMPSLLVVHWVRASVAG